MALILLPLCGRINGMLKGNYDHIAAIYESLFLLSSQALDCAAAYVKTAEKRVLDVGCGTGELAFALRQRGFDVVGIDSDPSMIKRAKERSGGLCGIDFTLLAMEKLKGCFVGSSFSLITCIGNTIAHLRDKNGLLEFSHVAFDLLVPSGSLLLQVLNYDMILRRRPVQLPPIVKSNLRFLRLYDYSRLPLTILFTTRLEDSNGKLLDERRLELSPFTRDDICLVLEKSGFEDITCFGGFDRSEPDEEKLPLVISARKPGDVMQQY